MTKALSPPDYCANDSWVGSLLWGRVGAAILVILSLIMGSLGFEFGHDEQGKAFEIISGILAAIGAGMALVSKVREKKRESDAACIEPDRLGIDADEVKPGDQTS